MSTIMGPQAPSPAPAEPPDDPYYLGWRYVPRIGPDGREALVRVPLTPKDVLHPQEEDFIVQNYAHDIDCNYLHNVFCRVAESIPTALVTSDLRLDWEVPGIEPHGADLALFLGFSGRPPRGTLLVHQARVRPVLVIEVTSPSTRDNDLGIKLTEYHRVGIPLYVIADAQEDDLGRQIRMLGYRHEPRKYVQLPTDEQGRLWLEPVRLWIGSKQGLIVCYDADGREFGNYVQVDKARVAAEARLTEEAQARTAAEARAQAEIEARQALEAQLRELQEKLRQAGGPRPDQGS